MKKLIVLCTAAAALLVAPPVQASDAPAGSGAPPGGPGLTQTAPQPPQGSDTGTWILVALLAIGAVAVAVYAFRQSRAEDGLSTQREERFAASSRDLARISSTLLAALIALMTFLVIVGVQTRVQGFTTELYTAIILLGIGLVLFALREHVAGDHNNVGLAKAIHRQQQLVFVGSIVAVVWFVISYAQLIVKPPSAQPEVSQPQDQSGQPPETQPGQPGSAATPGTGTPPPPAQPPAGQ